ncbi:hypothetical protein LAZ67_X003451 [Cordylochernes scorpioides]|uniref:Uncharacterized protein n=1 Tax=Cordylochernes scorpioides TaxID=51811 RepID=A0ABY6LU47_9ARAC|nr:hypothetical protein LAZ67_X003451 [Cordylochernes scorpioides]
MNLNVKKTNLEDEPRSGRPPTAVTQEKIELVRFLLREDRRITYQLLEKSADIVASAAINTIINDHLKFRKLVSRWDGKFRNSLNEVEAAAWNSFRNVCKNFLESVKVENYRDIVNDLLLSYKGKQNEDCRDLEAMGAVIYIFRDWLQDSTAMSKSRLPSKKTMSLMTTTTKPLFTPQEKGRLSTRDKVLIL